MVARASEIGIDSYAVHVGAGLLDRAGEIVHESAPAHRYAIISDANVAPLYASRLRDAIGGKHTELFAIPSGEEHKTREQWAALTDALIAGGFGRDSAILALGGGVVGDLAGFVAATYMRGIPFVQLPTTLLAMIDASIGGKTGVDTSAGKNLVGAFHRPRAVIADPAVLATLPRNHLRSGFAEAIKHGAIADAAYYDQIDGALPSILAAQPGDDQIDGALPSILAAPPGDDQIDGALPSTLAATDGDAMHALIVRSIEIKAGIVLADEREGGVRRNLNFGHTLGHAIESVSGYRMLHGEAIAIGMVLEAQLGEMLGVTAPGTAKRLRGTLTRAELPVAVPKDFDSGRILAMTRGDKKARGGVVEYALLSEIGTAVAGVRAPDETVLDLLTQSASGQ